MEFLKKIAEKLGTFAQARDPAEFNDDIAKRTEWQAFNKANSNVNLNRLMSDPDGHHLFYKPTIGLYFLSSAFVFMGLFSTVIIIGSTIQEGKPIDKDVVVPVLFCLVFVVVGMGIFLGLRKRLRFDMTERCMITGDNRTYFSDIHALQLVVQRGNKHRNYQLNLVLRDAERVHVMNYADSKTARADTARIASAIGIADTRIWDIMPGYDNSQNQSHLP
ncbi:MAG: hypothetical protein Q8K65_05075 [Alphaproteobacteria bacterium]|nr:hypothetical protein [Alphaproteobacteria bacterium]